MIENMKDVILNLQVGPLNALHIGEEDIEDLSDKQINRLVQITDMVLADLYTKFVLRVNTLEIMTICWKTTYELNSKFARSNKDSKEEHKYILDTHWEPFEDDIISIQAVYDELGCSLPIHDENDSLSVYIPSPRVIQFSYPFDNMVFEVAYQARHKKLHTLKEGYSREEILQQDIVIPFPLESALITKIASMYFLGLSGEGFSKRAQELLAEYSMLCDESKARNNVEYITAPSCRKILQKGFP